ncbi:MAG TPA: glycosyltransferase family 4 protein [Planctomycetota bacterium]|nr:glycosyltransferase family 4 protein [Planctomycetota bacterium]
MKIAIHHTRFRRSGGIERYIWLLVERLLGDGHEVHVFARRWDALPHPQLRFHHVPAIPLGEGWKALSFAYASARRLEGQDFDVVHSFTKTFTGDVYTDGSGCAEDFEAYRRTRSAWRRITTWRPLLAWAVRHIERRRFRGSDRPRVIAMSRGVRDQLVARHAFPAEKIEVLYSGVDTEVFHPRRREALRETVRKDLQTPPGALVALFIGNDYGRKGLQTAIEALSGISGPGPVLWVVGMDRRPGPYEALARRKGVDARFLGSSKDPGAFLAAADVFVFPSLYDAFGNVGLEALASGLPAIISRRAGVSEIIEDGVDGIILQDPESAAELRGHLETLLEPSRRAEMGVRARRKAEAFDLQDHFGRIISLYATVAADKHPR